MSLGSDGRLVDIRCADPARAGPNPEGCSPRGAPASGAVEVRRRGSGGGGLVQPVTRGGGCASGRRRPTRVRKGRKFVRCAGELGLRFFRRPLQGALPHAASFGSVHGGCCGTQVNRHTLVGAGDARSVVAAVSGAVALADTAASVGRSGWASRSTRRARRAGQVHRCQQQ
jgi:hypothetical protein